MRVALAVLVVAVTAVAAAHAATTPGFLGCKAFTVPHAKPAVRPASIMVACADGGFYLTNLKWSAWASTAAHGKGVAHQNDCTPYCAAGHFHAYAIRASLSAVRTCHGHRVFNKLGWTFTAGRPKGVPRSGSQTFGCG